MANMEGMVPFIVKWETGTVQKEGESPRELFERARKKGWAKDPTDSGGATQTGLTLGTYTNYCRRHNISKPTEENLRNIPYATWLAILKELFWDAWKADKINNQSIAQICVDWVWASGKPGITGVQKLLGVTADGIVGPKTLAALNSKAQMSLFYQIRQARYAFVENLVKRRPKDKKFLNGWKNRINDIKYKEC